MVVVDPVFLRPSQSVLLLSIPVAVSGFRNDVGARKLKTVTQSGRRKSEIGGAVMMLGSWAMKQNETSA